MIDFCIVRTAVRPMSQIVLIPFLPFLFMFSSPCTAIL